LYENVSLFLKLSYRVMTRNKPGSDSWYLCRTEGQVPIEECVDREWLFNFLQLNSECLVDVDDNDVNKGDSDCRQFPTLPTIFLVLTEPDV